MAIGKGAPPYGWNGKAPRQVPKDDLDAGKGAVYFDPQKIQNLIRQQGARVRVYRSSLCPNVKSIDGGEHNMECPICDGQGFVDAYPITTMAIIQTQELEKVAKAEGVWDNNSVMMTFDLGISLQYFTKIELLDYTDIFYELVKRQQGPLDVLKYKAMHVNMVMDANGRFYLPDSDFTLDENGSVLWNVGRGPKPGTIYTIHYEMYMTFRATKAIHVNRFMQAGRKSENVTMTKGPEQWMCTKHYFIERTDRKGNRLSRNLIRDPDGEDPNEDPNPQSYP